MKGAYVCQIVLELDPNKQQKRKKIFSPGETKYIGKKKKKKSNERERERERESFNIYYFLMYDNSYIKFIFVGAITIIMKITQRETK